MRTPESPFLDPSSDLPTHSPAFSRTATLTFVDQEAIDMSSAPVSPILAHHAFDIASGASGLASLPLSGHGTTAYTGRPHAAQTTTGGKAVKPKSRSSSLMGPPPFPMSTANRSAASASQSSQNQARDDAVSAKTNNSTARVTARAQYRAQAVQQMHLTTSLFYTPLSPRLRALDSPAGPCTPFALEEGDGCGDSNNNGDGYWHGARIQGPTLARALSDALSAGSGSQSISLPSQSITMGGSRSRGGHGHAGLSTTTAGLEAEEARETSRRAWRRSYSSVLASGIS